MTRRWWCLTAMVVMGCGRTDPVELSPLVSRDGGADAGLVRTDAGVDAGVDAGGDAGVAEPPFYVAVVGADACPSEGVEADLHALQPGERLVLVRTRALDECSGAGGEALVGEAVDEARGLLVSQHGCYYFPTVVRAQPGVIWWGVARVRSADPWAGPVGWCITDFDGNEPVRSDVKVRAWALFATEAAARAALR